MDDFVAGLNSGCYDNAAALDAHRATEHLKTYAAGTKDMVANRKVDQLSSVGMNRP